MNKDIHQRQITWSAVSSIVVLHLLLVTYMHFGQLLPANPEASDSTTAAQAERPEEVTICQLKSGPGKYNRKLVKVTAFLSHGFEDSVIFDPSCESRFGIWYEYGGTNVTGTMYCCGVTAARTRPEQVKVEGISIPLSTDQNFQTMDRLLHSTSDTIVHGTVTGRFFSGSKATAADGREWWSGYGHMGCCSLLMIQQVNNVDPHDRKDLDYRASADQPNMVDDGCGYQYLMELDPWESIIAAQKEADAGKSTLAFEDPERVATEKLANLLKKKPSSVRMVLKHKAQGRMIFEWKVRRERATYMVVVSRPYQLSFHAKTGQVAWVPIAAYRSSC